MYRQSFGQLIGQNNLGYAGRSTSSMLNPVEVSDLDTSLFLNYDTPN